MECDKIVDNKIGGFTKPKKKFNTMDDAISVAKYENSKPRHTHKVIAYKCKFCHKFHIGRNGKLLKDKERDRLSKETSSKKILKDNIWKSGIKNIKVIGYIDLSKL